MAEGTAEDPPPPSRGVPISGDFPEESDATTNAAAISETGLNRRARLVRQSRARGSALMADLEGDGCEKAQAVQIRTEHETEAMGSNHRKWRALVNFMRCGRSAPKLHLSASGRQHQIFEGKHQYRLNAQRIHNTRWQRFRQRLHNFICFGGTHGMYDVMSYGLKGPHNSFVNYLNWMFRASFLVFFIWGALVYYAGVMFFTGLIAIAGKFEPKCVLIGGEPHGHKGTQFSDAFTLSWTTFSTVGYGNASPALSDQQQDCGWITTICAVESLLGVLFSAFIGSILFGKLMRIQSQAQVLFSQPILIQYGPGVECDANFVDKEESNDDNEVRPIPIPCPVLEFRIANPLFEEVGGEIMDSVINVVARLDPDAVDPEIRGKISDTKSKTEKVDNFEDLESGIPRTHNSKKNAIETSLSQALFWKTQPHQAVEEDPTSKMIKPRIFSKLLLQASEHPFFKRTWLVRHVIDDTSPLLTHQARMLVQKNGGHWPEALNNAAAVRKSIQFDQILVSLCGVSNVSGSGVFNQKIYNSVDMIVGYQFVDILYCGNFGELKVDLDLLNDIVEQEGGGGEPLTI